jgi:hypothetical protein
MSRLVDWPVLMALLILPTLWLCSWLGARFLGHLAPRNQDGREEFSVLLGASLTLLGLLIGFTFSMAISRYDLRKNYEELEANAIGTAYARADLLPDADVSTVKELLREYTLLRVRNYSLGSFTLDYHEQLAALQRETERKQSQLWAAVVAPARAAPSATLAIAVASMNDVLNSQGYAQAASWNRIPIGAWALLCTIGLVATAMVGFRFRGQSRRRTLALVIPTLISISLFLIADIDCPRGGVIRVAPQNLLALYAGLH